MADVAAVLKGIEANIGVDGNHTYRASIQVTVDNKYRGPIYVANVIRTQLGFWIGSQFEYGNSSLGAYEYDTGAYLTSINPVQAREGDGTLWNVTLDFGPYNPDYIKPDNPLDVPPRWEWDSWSEERELIQDFTSPTAKTILNSAGEPFLNVVTVDRNYPLMRITRNEASYDESLAQTFRDSVNQASVTIKGIAYPARYLRCLKISGVEEYHSIIGKYFIVNYEIAVNPDTWDLKILDAGLNQLSSGKLIPIERDGIPVTQPECLNGSGVALAVGGTPVYLTFRRFPEKDFTTFNFPTAA